MAYDYVEDTGVIVPDTSNIQTEVEDEYKVVFGADLDVDPETPEGLLISAEVTSRSGTTTNNAQLANQINPNEAAGVFLDAIWALTGGARAAATPSTFSVAPDLTGVAFTLVPVGSLAATPAGDEFVTLDNVTLDSGGLGSVAFASVETGEIAAGVGDLSVIVSSVLGWETIDNTVAATLGVAEQSDISARRERNETLALQGASTSEAVFSNVRAVTGVKSLTYRENVTAVPITPTPPDNIDLKAHSVWVCVDGGSDVDVATALLNSKSSGSDWNNGNSAIPISENITDPLSGQIYPVDFDRPDLIPVLYEVTVQPSSISNVSSIIKAAVVAYANGELDGESGLVVGADVSGWEAAGAVSTVEPGLTVTQVRVTTVAAASFAVTTIDIELFEQATTDEASVTVIVA